MHSRHLRPHAPTAAEAGAWADTLVRYQLLHAAVRVPTGQWLIQHRADSPVHLLDDPAAVVELTAQIQQHILTTRPRTR